jgi:hypothetical protein
MTNRYGSKGVVSLILEDEEMPVSEDGIRVEVIMNRASVINRTNIMQLFEPALSFIANGIRNTYSGEERYEKFKDFFSIVDMDTYDVLSKISSSEFNDDLDKNGVYIKQNSFYDNIDILGLYNLYKKFPFEKHQFFIGEQPITTKMVMGDMYFIRLKQTAESKISVRSTGALDIKRAPSKTKSFKQHEELLSNTPIRIGGMELNYLYLLNDDEELSRFQKTYSSSDKARKKVVESILTSKEAIPDKIDAGKDLPSEIRMVVEQYFNSIALGIVEVEVDIED